MFGKIFITQLRNCVMLVTPVTVAHSNCEICISSDLLITHINILLSVVCIDELRDSRNRLVPREPPAGSRINKSLVAAGMTSGQSNLNIQP